jgi:hypothetical protein
MPGLDAFLRSRKDESCRDSNFRRFRFCTVAKDDGAEKRQSKYVGLQRGLFDNVRNLRNSFTINWSQLSDLNRRPTVYKTVALPLS